MNAANPAPGNPPSHLLRPGQGRAVLGLAVLVLLGHATLLGLLPPAPGAHIGPAGRRAAAVQVRQLAAPPRIVPHGGGQAATPPQAAPVRTGETARTSPQPPRPATPAERPAPTPSAAQPALAAAEVPAPAQVASPVDVPGGTALPLYATRPPPPATLHFTLRRGAASGNARLQWRVDGETYLLTLQGLAPGSPAIERSSQGAFDAAGIAPLRFAEGRRGRELRAANFQREAQVITFSGPAVAFALVPGSQDRLSWALQLAAVLSANPALAAAGAQVSMFVAGTRGDAAVWTFTVQGSEPLRLPAGEVNAAVHLLREAQGPYDTRAEAWLDPARHHLPVRLRMQVPALGEGTDMQLESMTLP